MGRGVGQLAWAATTVVVALWAPVARAAPPLTLDAAIDRALAQEPNLMLARAAAREAASLVHLKRAALLPQASLTAGYQRTTANFVARPGYVTAGNLGAARPASDLGKTFDFFSFGLSANQLVFDFGASLQAWWSAEAALRQATCQEAASLLAVYGQVATAFFGVHKELANLALRRELAGNQARHLALARGRQEVGAGALADVAQAHAAQAAAHLDVAVADANLATASLALARAMGEPPGSLARAPALVSARLAPLAEEEGSVDAAVAEAWRHNPQLAALEAALEAARRNVKSLRGELAPTLSVNASLSEQGGDIAALGTNWYVGAQLAVPLFSGLGGLAALRQGEAQLRSALARQQAARLSVAAQVADARARLGSLAATLAAARAADSAACAQRALVEGQYRAGLAPFLALDDAEVKARSAATQRLAATYDLEVARAALVVALGDATLWRVVP